jgi:predicted Zn-dependent protease
MDVRILWDQGRKEEALERLTTLVQEHPTEWHFTALLALYRAQQGYSEEAQELCDSIEIENPDSRNVWEMVKATYQTIGNKEGVLRATKRERETEIPQERPMGKKPQE